MLGGPDFADAHYLGQRSSRLGPDKVVQGIRISLADKVICVGVTRLERPFHSGKPQRLCGRPRGEAAGCDHDGCPRPTTACLAAGRATSAWLGRVPPANMQAPTMDEWKR